jgi:hypothetical protein
MALLDIVVDVSPGVGSVIYSDRPDTAVPTDIVYDTSKNQACEIIPEKTGGGGIEQVSFYTL